MKIKKKNNFFIFFYFLAEHLAQNGQRHDPLLFRSVGQNRLGQTVDAGHTRAETRCQTAKSERVLCDQPSQHRVRADAIRDSLGPDSSPSLPLEKGVDGLAQHRVEEGRARHHTRVY